MGKEFKLCQFADDTTIFLKDIHEVNKAVDCINDFSFVSGLCMNLSKSVIFPLKTAIYQIYLVFQSKPL